MHMIWPESGTLSEVGAGAAQGGGSGMPGAGGGAPGGGAGMMAAPQAGEVILNRAESAALAAMESEEDEAHGFRRAKAESGLTHQQLTMLKRRATTLSSKGYTLKGMNFVKKPLAASPDDPGLTRKAVKGDDSDANPEPKPKAAKPATAKTKETTGGLPLLRRTVADPLLYTLPEDLDYGLPVPHSASEAESDPTQEAHSQTTLHGMLSRNRRKKRTLL